MPDETRGRGRASEERTWSRRSVPPDAGADCNHAKWRRDSTPCTRKAFLARMDPRYIQSVSPIGETNAKICVLGRVFEVALTRTKIFDIISKDGAVPKW